MAKCYANRLKHCLHDLIHTDQSGFMKGRNIGNNIRLILDMIEYTEFNDIPGSILLIDIEKAFDSVSHSFLFQTLKHLNFGQNFIDSIKTLYSARHSYVMNNGFLTDRISMKRGIFQGCPISPYLFLLVIEIMALSIRQNDLIKGIPITNQEAKISLFADDSVCFLDFLSSLKRYLNLDSIPGVKSILAKLRLFGLVPKEVAKNSLTSTVVFHGKGLSSNV